LRKFLYANLYYHPDVAGVNRRACRMLRGVFHAYLDNPKLLGRNAVRRVRREGLERAVCDYLSGMTDSYVLDEHARVCAPSAAQAAASALR
jgi:dGTPase